MTQVASSSAATAVGSESSFGSPHERDSAPPRPSRPNGSRALPSLVLAAPALALIAFIYLIPTVANIFYSFTNFSTWTDSLGFVGLDNYRQSIEIGGLANSLSITLRFAALVVLGQNLLGLGLALVLSRPGLLSHFSRMLLFAPILIAPLASGYVWRAIFSLYGPLNAVLSFATGHSVSIEWLGDPAGAMAVIIGATIWRGLGLTALLYLAALLAVPQSVYEAARIEGAGRMYVFRTITAPLIIPGILVNIVLSVIGSLYAFDMAIAVTLGGPGYSTTVLNLLMYQTFGDGQFGDAAAMSNVLYICVAIAVLPLILFLRRREVQL